MTEAEWLVSADPAKMLAQAQHWQKERSIGLSARKLRLFAFAVARLIDADIDGKRSEALSAEYLAASRAHIHLAEETFDKSGVVISGSFWCLHPNTDAAAGEAATHEREMGSGLVRDICGNPWRPAPAMWLGHGYDSMERMQVAVKIAQHIYESPEFDLMPQLADALEDASCSDESILAHCRGYERCLRYDRTTRICAAYYQYGKCELCNGTGWMSKMCPCVRGCWVVDIILGKE